EMRHLLQEMHVMQQDRAVGPDRQRIAVAGCRSACAHGRSGAWLLVCHIVIPFRAVSGGSSTKSSIGVGVGSRGVNWADKEQYRPYGIRERRRSTLSLRFISTIHQN